jgi:GAF domain
MSRCCGIAAGKPTCSSLPVSDGKRVSSGPRRCRPIYGRLPVARSRPPIRSNIRNFDEQQDFIISDLLRQHHIVSLVNVPVLTAGAAWGVLEIDSTSPRDFSQDTIEFLTAAAAFIAAFVQRHTAEPGEAARVAAAAVEAQNRDVLLREINSRPIGLVAPNSRSPNRQRRAASSRKPTYPIREPHNRWALRLESWQCRELVRYLLI